MSLVQPLSVGAARATRKEDKEIFLRVAIVFLFIGIEVKIELVIIISVFYSIIRI